MINYKGIVMRKQKFYCKYIKRIIDIILSLLAIIVLSPIIVVTALLVRIKLGKPILFKQERAGLQERPFFMYKFRSMTNETDSNGTLLPDEKRLTRFGERLRRLSLDELPGLINVIKGEMSLIGPRPLPIQYLDYYNVFQKRRHEVKPGIVGLASIRGRNNQSWESKFKNDIEYVDTVSLLTDIKIFFLAIVVVLKQNDINREGYVAGEPFIQQKDEALMEKKK